jgi:hypothetical protein
MKMKEIKMKIIKLTVARIAVTSICKEWSTYIYYRSRLSQGFPSFKFLGF